MDDTTHKDSPPQPPPPLHIFPPLLNSANPWATTLADLTALFECPSTGAVTIRTSVLGNGLGNGFPHDDAVHQYTFFDPCRHEPSPGGGGGAGGGGGEDGGDGGDGSGSGGDDRYSASLNTLGYSPVPLDAYLGYIRAIAASEPATMKKNGDGDGDGGKEKGKEKEKEKYFIVSVTGNPDEVAECYRRVARLQAQLQLQLQPATGPQVRIRLAVEVNLSCPNIRGKPPPAYSGEALAPYLVALRDAAEVEVEGGGVRVPWGLKTPPYTHAGQFETLVATLRGAGVVESNITATPAATDEEKTYYSPATFLTATNTLGSCLVLSSPTLTPKLANPSDPGSTTGIGGLAGPPLHPLALGNVATLRRLLDAHPSTRHISIIGVGGVEDAAGYRRMRAVGAEAVAVGTALGRRGVGVFGEIEGALFGGGDSGGW